MENIKEISMDEIKVSTLGNGVETIVVKINEIIKKINKEHGN